MQIRLLNDKRGLETLEWAGVAAVLVILALIAYGFLGGQLQAFIMNLGSFFH